MLEQVRASVLEQMRAQVRGEELDLQLQAGEVRLLQWAPLSLSVELEGKAGTYPGMIGAVHVWMRSELRSST